MPKSSKKRKEKTQDFTKAKLKLGKGKRVASNVVDTTFKARSIIVPNQSVSKEKGGSLPTTHRKLTLDDLLSRLKHHNASVRKDSLLGLEELVRTHPELIDASLTTIIQSTARQIGDEDINVRRAVLSFLKCIISLAPSTSLHPHAHTLLLFTASALTHIFPEVRVDASKVLNLLLEQFTTLAVEGWDSENVNSQSSGCGSRILHALLSLLHASPKDKKDLGSTSNFNLSLASKLSVLTTLANFVGIALSGQNGFQDADDNVPTWFFEPFFTSQERYVEFVNSIRPTKSHSSGFVRYWRIEEGDQTDFGRYVLVPQLGGRGTRLSAQTDANVQEQGRNFSKGASVIWSRDQAVLLLLSSLQPVLTSIVLENAPMVFLPSVFPPPQSELKLLLCSLRLAKQLHRQTLQMEDAPSQIFVHELWSYLIYMAPYFPASFPPLLRRDVKLEAIHQEFNVLFIELTTIAAFATNTGPAAGKSSSLPVNQKALVLSATEFILQTLTGGGLTNDTFKAMLPSVWMLLQDKFLGSPSRAEVLEAMLSHDSRLSAQSTTKSTSIEFCARLILLEGFRGITRSLKMAECVELRDKLSSWLLELPRALWELGTKCVTTSEMIALAMIRMVQQKTRFLNEEIITRLCSRLTPYFLTLHPSRGYVPGPFTHLAECNLRKLIIHLVITLVSVDPTTKPAQELLHAAREAASEGMEEQILGVLL